MYFMEGERQIIKLLTRGSSWVFVGYFFWKGGRTRRINNLSNRWNWCGQTNSATGESLVGLVGCVGEEGYERVRVTD